MNKKRKLRFVINTLSGGGAEKVLVDLLNKIDPDKYDLTLITIEGGTHASRLPSHVKYKCIVPFSNSKFVKVVKQIVYKLSPKTFAFLFLRGNYDIEIAYLEGTPTNCVAYKKGGKKIAFVHCDFSANNIVKSFYGNKEKCYSQYSVFDRVCFVSDASKKGFESVVGMLNNSCVVHNIVNYEEVFKLSLEIPLINYTTKGLKLVTVGRLVKEKGFDRLLHVVSKLEKRFDFELFILGEGDEHANLEQIITEQDIKSARLIGFQKNPYPYFKNADLFVCSSYTEGYSTVVTEAVALGLPVITTDCAGMKEILDNGKYGSIIDNDEKALYMILKSIMDERKTLDMLKDKALQWGIDHKKSEELVEYTELFEMVLG